LAFAHIGKTDNAEDEQKAFHDLVEKIPPDTMYSPLNKAGAVFKIHGNLLAVEIARSRHDDAAALDLLNRAVAAEDALHYDEPPDWYPPIRPVLGRVLLDAKRFAEAEKVFRADLARNPRNARSLAGLSDCLKTQGRDYDADEVDQQFRAVWKFATAEGATTPGR
jgi:tetratricopeptide (TPR) repeat protein